MLYRLLTATVICATVALVCFRAQFIMRQATQKIEKCLLKAVDLHHDKIFTQNREPVTYVYSPKKDSSAAMYLGDHKIKLPAQSRSDLRSAIKMVDYTILHNKQTVQYGLLDSLFKAKLQNERFPSETFILTHYSTPNKTITYPNNRKTVWFTIKTNPVLLGISKELSIVAGVNMTFTTFLKWLLTDHIVLILLSGCGAVVTALHFFPMRHIIPAILPSDETEDSTPSYQYATIRINMEDHSVYIGSERIDTSPRNFTLLLMFLTSEDRFVAKEKIVDAFWSAKIDCSDRLNTTINRLRACLKKSDPNLNIAMENDGYRLVSTGTNTTTVEEVNCAPSFKRFPLRRRPLGLMAGRRKLTGSNG